MSDFEPRAAAGLNEAIRLANAARLTEHPEEAADFVRAALRRLGRIEEETRAGRDELCDQLDAMLDRPSQRLAVYGTLGRGRSNHHVVAAIPGRWFRGTVEGTLHKEGWGTAEGFPGMIWRPGSGFIEVDILESASLPDQWPRLDAFEGREYVRILVPVETECGQGIVANVYSIRRFKGGSR